MSSRSGFGRSLAERVQPLARLLVELAAQDEAAVLERLQQFLRRAFARRPRERQPLDTVGVGVLRRGEAAALERELAQHVVDRQVGDPPVTLVAEPARRVQIHRGEQRVVVEHLLEVRHEPALVDGVAVKAAADDVPHAAEDHRVEREARHRLLVAAEQELEHRRGRELRPAAPAAPLGIETAAQVVLRQREQVVAEWLRRRLQPRTGANVLGELCGGALDLAPLLVPGLGDREEHLLERRQPMSRLRREVRAAEERLAGRGQEDRHRPAALARQRDDGIHVHRVEIGPLFAVDLDADEALVHHPCGEGVLERLVLHHVAPVARRVPDREQDRPVLLACARERLLAPRKPVDRIAGVLLEVRRCLLGQAVHTGSLGHRL